MGKVSKFTSIGGQAVIEGVMMRSPHFTAVAVRKPDGKIQIKHSPYRSIAERFPILKKPMLRGVVTLVESMVQGIGALSYSASVAVDEEAEEELSSWAIAGSIFTAFILGLGLFVALPHFLTAWVTSQDAVGIPVESPLFHLFDGVLKMLILVTYIYGISMMEDIRRVFQYHGAEHKSIYAFEAGEDLSVENARKHTTLHPRCGTSFLLFLVLISIAVFSIVFPLFGWTTLSENTILNHVLMVFVKIGLMFPVAGLSYEFIKMCAGHMDRLFFRFLIWPGLVLQNLTTREPDDTQLEVALASLRQVLLLEKNPEKQIGKEMETEIGTLGDLGLVAASVGEFPE